MDYKTVLDISSNKLLELKNQTFPIITLAKPPDVQYAKYLITILSKLSPLVANVVEMHSVNLLNSLNWNNLGKWVKQDPNFPDLLFEGSIKPNPGIEIKTWFPLSTEITARFRESMLYFEKDQTNVAVIAWLPENVVYGQPKILDVWIGSGKSMALARDNHYHNPPDYLIFEPEDTSLRTRNLQQTNVNGYKFQGTPEQLKRAKYVISKWKKRGYQATKEYQALLKTLLRTYPYRLDTNFSKIDRIDHKDLEEFKTKVLNTKIKNHKISEWSGFMTDNDERIRKLIEKLD